MGPAPPVLPHVDAVTAALTAQPNPLTVPLGPAPPGVLPPYCVLYPDPGAIERLDSETNLTSQERNVLAAIDSEKTIRELVNQMPGRSFEVCKILYQLLNSRLVRRKTPA